MHQALKFFFEWLSCSVSLSSEHNLGIGSITSYHHLVLTSTLSISQVTNIFDTVIYTFFFCLIAYWPAIPSVLCFNMFRLYTSHITLPKPYWTIEFQNTSYKIWRNILKWWYGFSCHLGDWLDRPFVIKSLKA